MSWSEQWLTLLRWQRRLQAARLPRVHDGPLDMGDWRDDTQAAFMAAYHLKDWLKNDPASGLRSDVIEAAVTASGTLTLAADLANGIKHLVLKSSGRSSGLAPSVGGGNVSLVIGAGPTTVYLQSLGVDFSDGTTRDALDLLEEIIEEWRRHLARWNLKPPQLP